MKVKICGITSEKDARLACRLGVDAIGLNFYERSPRFVGLRQARRIARAVTPLTWVVGVFVDAPLERIERTVREVGLHAVQLHGNEPEALVAALRVPVLAVTHVGAGPLRLSRRAPLVLLDAAQPGYGGGGVTFEWKRARTVARRRPIFLAGGLTADNVGAAIATVRPFGVDVASGVERQPGVKDPHKLAAFVAAARRAA
ncbi:MAG: phosphoribosylanthranilate isomerase [Myxococcota bacterium]